MHLFPISDVHIGMREKFFEEKNIRRVLGFIDGYDDIVMCACGDIGDRMEGVFWLQKVLSIFPNLRVVYTPGNHEFYCHNLDVLPYDLESAGRHTDRLYILDGAYEFSHKIDDVTFIGAPLWTNFNFGAPEIMNIAQRQMNDYKCIKSSGAFKAITADRIYNEHGNQRKEIFNRLNKVEGKCVVLSHHSPIIINGGHAGDGLSYAYYSDLTEWFNSVKNVPTYWFSGHTHSSYVCTRSFTNGETMFVSNQMGYPIEVNSGFSTNCILEI